MLASAGAWGQARSYSIDARESRVQLRVERGSLALLADDQVLVAEGIAGRVRLDPAQPEQATLLLSLPVASLRVAGAEERAALGLDDDLDDADRAEILETLLSPEVLDGDKFPRIVATLETVTGGLPDLLLGMRVRIRQAERVVAIPVRIVVQGDALEATGVIALLQSDFGIEPYSAALGLISVKDRFSIRFRVLARAEIP